MRLQITFVGQIRNITTQATNITYKVDDGTGTIEVKQWIDNEAITDPMDTDSTKVKLAENGYCRIWGRLKAFGNKRHVGAHVIRPITDLNEINYHLLEATYVHLFFARGPPNTGSKDAQNGTTATNGNADAYADPSTKAMASVSPLARRVFQMLKTTDNNEGLHAQFLAPSLSTSVGDVYKAADELVQIGLAYTTVDDQTWAVLEL